MRGFERRAEVDAGRARVGSGTGRLSSEPVKLLEAAGRVLAEPVVSAVEVPSFARGAMDGFAVRAADIAETREGDPVALEIVGEAMPARPYEYELRSGEAVRITTGAPVPAGADAVLMAELAWPEGECHVLAPRPVAVGKHVVRVGADVAI